MEFLGVEFSEQELGSFQSFFPDAQGARLMNRLMVRNAEPYEALLHDPESSLEQLRFAQGALEGLGKLGLMVKQMIGFVVGEEADEDDREEAEEQVEMDF